MMIKRELITGPVDRRSWRHRGLLITWLWRHADDDVIVVVVVVCSRCMVVNVDVHLIICRQDQPVETACLKSHDQHRIIDPYSINYRPTLQCESKKIPLGFSDIFPKRLVIFSPNFARLCLLRVPIYARLQFFYPVICNFDEVMPY